MDKSNFTTIQDFEFPDKKKILGEGAFSKVFKAYNKTTKKHYALKKLNILNLSKADLQNLQKEVTLHKTLKHINIIKFESFFKENIYFYFLLEYAKNGCLFFYIHSQKGLPEKLALRFFFQIAKALQYLHKSGIIHRDIKPENILLDENFNVKLCDFGWACYLKKGDTRNSICGTFEYMAPEIIFKQKHAFEADIWGLGILLYEMLHGCPPFKAANLEEIYEEFSCKKIRISKSFSKSTKSLLKKLLRRDEGKRITVDEVFESQAYLSNLDYFNRDISDEELNILCRNFLVNSDYGNGRTLPESFSGINVEEFKKFKNKKFNFSKNKVKKKFKKEKDIKKKKYQSFYGIEKKEDFLKYQQTQNRKNYGTAIKLKNFPRSKIKENVTSSLKFIEKKKSKNDRNKTKKDKPKIKKSKKIPKKRTQNTSPINKIIKNLVKKTNLYKNFDSLRHIEKDKKKIIENDNRYSVKTNLSSIQNMRMKNFSNYGIPNIYDKKIDMNFYKRNIKNFYQKPNEKKKDTNKYDYDKAEKNFYKKKDKNLINVENEYDLSFKSTSKKNSFFEFDSKKAGKKVFRSSQQSNLARNSNCESNNNQNFDKYNCNIYSKLPEMKSPKNESQNNIEYQNIKDENSPTNSRISFVTQNSHFSILKEKNTTLSHRNILNKNQMHQNNNYFDNIKITRNSSNSEFKNLKKKKENKIIRNSNSSNFNLNNKIPENFNFKLNVYNNIYNNNSKTIKKNENRGDVETNSRVSINSHNYRVEPLFDHQENELNNSQQSNNPNLNNLQNKKIYSSKNFKDYQFERKKNVKVFSNNNFMDNKNKFLDNQVDHLTQNNRKTLDISKNKDFWIKDKNNKISYTSNYNKPGRVSVISINHKYRNSSHQDKISKNSFTDQKFQNDILKPRNYFEKKIADEIINKNNQKNSYISKNIKNSKSQENRIIQSKDNKISYLNKDNKNSYINKDNKNSYLNKDNKISYISKDNRASYISKDNRVSYISKDKRVSYLNKDNKISLNSNFKNYPMDKNSGNTYIKNNKLSYVSNISKPSYSNNPPNIYNLKTNLIENKNLSDNHNRISYTSKNGKDSVVKIIYKNNINENINNKAKISYTNNNKNRISYKTNNTTISYTNNKNSNNNNILNYQKNLNNNTLTSNTNNNINIHNNSNTNINNNNSISYKNINTNDYPQKNNNNTIFINNYNNNTTYYNNVNRDSYNKINRNSYGNINNINSYNDNRLSVQSTVKNKNSISFLNKNENIKLSLKKNDNSNSFLNNVENRNSKININNYNRNSKININNDTRTSYLNNDNRNSYSKNNFNPVFVNSSQKSFKNTPKFTNPSNFSINQQIPYNNNRNSFINSKNEKSNNFIDYNKDILYKKNLISSNKKNIDGNVNKNNYENKQRFSSITSSNRVLYKIQEDKKNYDYQQINKPINSYQINNKDHKTFNLYYK